MNQESHTQLVWVLLIKMNAGLGGALSPTQPALTQAMLRPTSTVDENTWLLQQRQRCERRLSSTDAR